MAVYVYREQPGFEESVVFDTVSDAVDYLVETGYVYAYNPYKDDDHIRVSTRLTQVGDTRWRFRADPVRNPNTWRMIVAQVRARMAG